MRDPASISPTNQSGWDTISPDQADDILQDQIFFLGCKSDRKCLCNKAADIPVNTIPAARSDMGIHNFLSGISCHATTGCPENVIQDHGEVYDIAHHASNIFLADMHEAEQPVGDTSRWSLTCLDIHRKPNPRTCCQIHSSHYRQLNSLDISTYCVIHPPRQCAASWYS